MLSAETVFAGSPCTSTRAHAGVRGAVWEVFLAFRVKDSLIIRRKTPRQIISFQCQLFCISCLACLFIYLSRPPQKLNISVYTERCYLLAIKCFCFDSSYEEQNGLGRRGRNSANGVGTDTFLPGA